MAATASIEIVVDDQGATQAFRNINNEAAKLGPTLAPVSKISEQTFNNIEGGALKSREAAALFGEELGVKVPRAIRGVIAESSLLGPAFAAAFSGLAIVAFVELAKQAVEQLTGMGAAMANIQKANDAMMQSVASANKILLGPQNIEQISARLADAQKRVLELNQALGLTGDFFGDSLKTGLASKFGVASGMMVEELNKQKTIVDDLSVEYAKLKDEQQRIEPVEILKVENATRLAGLEGIAKINEAERGETQVLREEIAKHIGDAAVEQREITKIHAEAAAARAKLEREASIAGTQAILDAHAAAAKGEQQIYEEHNAALHRINQQEIQEGIQLTQQKLALQITANNKLLQLRIQNAEEIRRVEEQAAVDSLPPWQQAYAQIAVDTQRRLREIQQALNDTRITAEDDAKLSAAAWQEEFAKTRDKLASDLESAFDQITSGGIGKYFLTQFKHLVFQMVASWILGMNQMRAASQQSMGSGGGILGAIFGSLGLGGIFGGGVAGGAQGGIGGLPGVITNFMGGGASAGSIMNSDIGQLPTSIPGLGISSGMGAGLGTVLPAGTNPASGIGGILSKIFPNGLNIGGLQISGTMLAAAGVGLLASNFMGGGILHGLGGALGGALLGTSIFPGIGTAIGAIVGFFSGFISHSTKKARLAIEANIKAQAQAIEDGYNLFQIDWSSSRSQLEALRQQGVDALKQAGVKDIDRSRVGHVDHWIDKAEKEIDATQAERNARSALTFGPAQFRTGGFVAPGIGGSAPAWFTAGAMHFASGGAVPAILHEGEFVMRPEAVNAIGRGNLERMNAGGGGAGDVHVHLNVIDGASTEAWLSRGGLKAIWRAVRRARMEGAI